MLYLDTETCGLTGPVTLIQYGTSKDDIKLHYPWDVPVQDTLDLISSFFKHDTFVLFNAAYDSFHLNKCYNTWSMVADKTKKPDREEIFDIEKYYWRNNICLRPKKCYDLYILIRRHILQFLMVTHKDRFIVRKVPRIAAGQLTKHLEEYAKTLNPLLFHKSKGRDRWEIKVNDENPDFVDIVLNFHATSALKPIMKHLLGKEVSGIEIPPTYMPQDEKEYKPYNNTWPKVLNYHLDYWHSAKGMHYAKNDIEFLVDLQEFIISVDHMCEGCGAEIFSGEQCHNITDNRICGEMNPVRWPKNVDIDSDLAWMIGQVRASGFSLDMEKLRKVLKDAEISRQAVPTAPAAVMKYLRVSPDWEHYYSSVVTSTNAKTLDQIIGTKYDLDTRKPLEDQSESWGDVADRALAVKKERELLKQIDLLNKLAEVGRAHPDFAASGTKSNRMAGRGGINYQGINRDNVFRELFTMVDDGYKLSGGDFEGQEVSILAAVASDPALTADLKKYKSIHLIMWRILYNDPDATLQEIKAPRNKERYTRCKNCVFAWFYGAEDEKFAETGQISVERAREVRIEWYTRYPGFANYKSSIERNHSSIIQPGGIGTNVIYNPPAKFIESLLGYRRYYNLENGWIQFAFELAGNLPVIAPCRYCSKGDVNGTGCSRCNYKGNHDYDSVYRRQHEQKVRGAVQSALYGAAFGVQSSVLRTAGNHVIQSTGGEITKKVQHRIWSLQPEGIADFVVKPMNVHDEVVTVNNCPELVSEKVYETVEELKEVVPLLAIDWKESIPNWAGK